MTVLDKEQALERIAQAMKDLQTQHVALPNHTNTLNAQALNRIGDVLRQAGWLT